MKKLKMYRLIFVGVPIIIGISSFILGFKLGQHFQSIGINGPDVPQDDHNLIYMILVIPVPLICALVSFISYKIFWNKMNYICRKCSSSLKGTSYFYEETSRIQEKSGREYANVLIGTTCNQCGARNSFLKKFLVYSPPGNNYGAMSYNYSIKAESLAKKYYR